MKIEAATEAAYFNAVETLENVVLRPVPSPLTTEMIATAMPAAMRPYSIAVAALSSFKNLTIRRNAMALRAGTVIYNSTLKLNS
jgi:hypothetical protein